MTTNHDIIFEQVIDLCFDLYSKGLMTRFEYEDIKDHLEQAVKSIEEFSAEPEQVQWHFDHN